MKKFDYELPEEVPFHEHHVEDVEALYLEQALRHLQQGECLQA